MDAGKNEKSSTPHKWRFARVGGFDQVRLETGGDLLALDQLDQKLWASLSCPTHGLELDSRTLELIDSDGDGRIRVPEMLTAVKWIGSVLKNPDDLAKRASALPLSAIDESTPEGAQLLASAKQILLNLGKPDAAFLTAEDTADTATIFAKTKFNGDGIIPVDAADDDQLKSVIMDIMECLESELDRSGEPGITQEKADQFYAELQDYSDWWGQAEGDAAKILVFGDSTSDAAEVFKAVRTKVDDYFTRCRLAEFDSGAVGPLNPSPEEYQAMARKDLSASVEEVAALPLATIGVGKPLPLDEGVNPAWIHWLSRLRTAVVKPMFGDKAALDAGEWALISARFVAFESWLDGKKGAAVEKLGLERVREILALNVKASLTTLIEKDKALEQEANSIASVDKLVRYHRDIFTLLNNFASFQDFYSPGTKAIFQVGSLYMDGRSCDLCIKVDDIAKHSSMANLSQTYLAYCECRRNGDAEKMNIAAALTDGSADNLMVGRNGVFYDRKGNDWDATVVKITEHPISIREAFWSPYKQIAKMISEQIEKVAASKDKKLKESASAGISGATTTAEAGKPPEPPFDVGKFAGIFAAIGLAIGAIGTALASVLTGFLSLSWWQMPLGVAGLMLFVSGPSMVMAYFKLRKRNLAPILDANGWAVNTRATINIPFGKTLTALAKLPEGAQYSVVDPFAEKERPWKLYIFLVAVAAVALLLWQKGYVSDWLKKANAPKQETSQAPAPAPAPTRSSSCTNSRPCASSGSCARLLRQLQRPLPLQPQRPLRLQRPLQLQHLLRRQHQFLRLHLLPPKSNDGQPKRKSPHPPDAPWWGLRAMLLT